MKTIRILAVVMLLAAIQPALAASTKEEVQALREQVAAMQKDIDEIKQLLQRGARPAAPQPPPFEPQDVTLGPSPYLGDADAVVTLVEYSDYQCPFCARHARTVLPTLVTDYVESGKLKYVMRENPIPQLHPQAFNASLAALCAGEQDAYWAMHDRLFDNQRALSPDFMKSLAAEMGLDTVRFDDCLDSRKFEEQVKADIASAADMGVRGTPGFLVGLTDPDDPNSFRATEFIRGAQPLPAFRRAVEALLQSAENADG